MSFKEWLSEYLFPKAFSDMRAYERMKAEAIDSYHWLNGYPDARDTLRWLLDNDHNRRRCVGDRSIGNFPSSIDQFREVLETRRRKSDD